MSDSHFGTGSDSDASEDAVQSSDELMVQPVPLTLRQRLVRYLSRPETWRSLMRLRIRWPRLMLAAVMLSVVGLGLALMLLNSPLLDITTVKVEGAEVVSPASVRQLAGLKGEHVLLADLEAATQRIAALPMVKEVAITRDWPNGVKVVIVERTPWGRWRANNTVWAIDSEGVVLEGHAPPFDGPIVTQVSALPVIAAGATVDTTAVNMVRELDERGAPLSLPAVVAYEWSLSEGLVVVTEHGRIVFGGADGLDFKYHVWSHLEHEAQNRDEPLMFADLRFGLRPRVEIGLNVGRGFRNGFETSADLASERTNQTQLTQTTHRSEQSQH